ncbi:MAG: ribosome biogenesis GTPase YqeH [Solobacterium sp.]|nr:ribosome biogenesis GTPase YqeH [Solobacterium sp.]
MTICKGCGVTLQHKDPNKPGYTPKEEGAYCQRCFRIMHYDDLLFSLRDTIPPEKIIQEISSKEGIILWIVDLYDFESSMIPELEFEFKKRDVFLVCTKRDILPKAVKEDKLLRFVERELKDRNLSIDQIHIVSLKDSVDSLKQEIKDFAKGRNVIVVGRANVGKSTLLNRFLQKKDLTSSRYPGTTQAFLSTEIDGVTYIDTPGIELEGSMIMKVKEEDLIHILPTKEVFVQIYQIHENQSFIIGGLAQIDFETKEEASIAFYEKDELNIHRCKTDNKEELWKKHYGELFQPIPMKKEFETIQHEKQNEKEDVVISGLGFIYVSGNIDKICVTVPKGVTVAFRKAMI